jgi:outer membrane biosynthesis protein TonB
MSYPQLPPVPPDFTDADGINALEVVIGEDGLVQSVRLLSEPRRLTDMMLLSAARTWRFTPATLDGVSVPYRTAIRWAVPQP